MRKKSVLLLLLLFWSTGAIMAQDGPDHLRVKRLNDSFIDVYYNKPMGKVPLPLLIFCQGSGSDSNTNGFLGLLGQFRTQAVGLAIEKQGVKLGDDGTLVSEEYKKNNLIQNRLYDYLRVLQYLRINASWWNGEIYVIGGSEGGLLAGMLASFYPNTKAVAILSFGGGLSFGEAWPVSIDLQKRAEGLDSEVVESAVRAVKDTLDMTRIDPTYLRSFSGTDNTYAWWNSISELRLENALMDLDIPIYLAQGSADEMAPVASSKLMVDDFEKAGKTNLRYREYAGFDHGFNDRDGKSHLVQVFSETIRIMLNRK